MVENLILGEIAGWTKSILHHSVLRFFKERERECKGKSEGKKEGKRGGKKERKRKGESRKGRGKEKRR